MGNWTGRLGITLLEVLIALAIFLGSMVAMSQLISTGVQASVQARLQTQAILRCESKMAEIVAGVEPLEASADVPFEDDEQWTWSLETLVGPHDDLIELVVTTTREGQSGLSTASYTLRRYIRDPQVFVDAEEAALAAETEEAT